MGRAFTNDRELAYAYTVAEEAIRVNGKIKIGNKFYHVLGHRFIHKEQAVRLRNMIDQVGYYMARVYRVSDFDPRYDVAVRRKK
ncbi:MAG: hypothetical protein PHG61_03640 [Candidatus Marinimicrobia bacterium]|nr:hypothetical protein [Candidatus Neomarinimicrobiota bacterium]